MTDLTDQNHVVLKTKLCELDNWLKEVVWNQNQINYGFGRRVIWLQNPVGRSNDLDMTGWQKWLCNQPEAALENVQNRKGKVRWTGCRKKLKRRATEPGGRVANQLYSFVTPTQIHLHI